MHNEREKAKRIFAKIIAAYPGELRGRFRLVKAFYYAHLFYWDENADTLTEHPIVKMDRGPGVKDYRGLLGELCSEKQIEEVEAKPVEGESNRLFRLIESIALDEEDEEDRAIIRACKHVAKYSREELTEKTHRESHSWKEAKEGCTLDIYRDLMNEDEYSKMCGELAKLRSQVKLG